MKKYFYAAIVIILLMAPPAFGKQGYYFKRFSSNPIPPLNIVGVALSESIDSAKWLVEEGLRKQNRTDAVFDIYIDPTYRQLKAQKVFDISFYGKSATGGKFEAEADKVLDLKAAVTSLIIVDRTKKVRAFTQGGLTEWDDIGKVIEELLLNLDGKELITIAAGISGSKDIGWQTDLGKAKEGEKGKKVGFTTDFGASKLAWYKYLGQEIPDVKLKKMDNADTTLHDLINGKVSAIIVFAASTDQRSAFALPGIAHMTAMGDALYYDLTKGGAKPGSRNVLNAKHEAMP